MGLIAHYRLDDLVASIGPDITYFNNSGKLVPADGKLGAAYQRMGLNDGTDYLGTTEDIYLSSSFTMACWAYVTSAQASANGLVTNHSYSANTGAGITVKYISSTDFRISCNTGTGTSRTFHSYYGTSNIKDRWAHLLLRFDASTNNLSLWVDGVKEFEMTYAMKCVPDKLQLFKWSTSYDGAGYLPGAIIDDVRIYDHALSKHEVKDLAKGLVFHLEANETGPKDKSLQAHTLANYGATYTADVPVGKGGYEFTQDGQRIDTGNKFNFKKTDSFTVGFWINPEDHSFEATAAGGVIGKGHWYNNTWDVFMYSYNALCFECSGNATRNGYAQVVSPVLPLHTPSYFAVTYNAGEITGYLNGEVFATATYSGVGDFNNTNNTLVGMRYGDPSRTLKGVLADLRIYATALTAADIKELYQRRASLDAQGNFYAGLINDTGIKQPLLLNWTQWQDGQSGSVGMFNYYAVEADCKRLFADNPWGKQTIVWHTQSSGGSSGNGGYYTDLVSVDASKLHRVSVWMRRVSPGNGRGYSGILTDITPLRRDTGAPDGNAYFWYSNTGFAGMPTNEWVLVVGHVWPEGSPTGANHPDSGIYTTSGRIASIYDDFIFGPGAQSLAAGAFLHYATDATTVQQLAYPRMDVCDGTEPSIAELLAGFDSRNESLLRVNNGQVPSLSINTVTSGNFSELGITDGLVAYYPLTKDAKDYSGNGNHGTVNGAVPVSGGFDGKGAFSFDNTGNQWINIDSNFTEHHEITFSCWVRPKGNHKNYTGTVISSGNWNGLHWAFGLNYDNSAIQTRRPNRSIPYSFALNKWHHIVWAFKSGYHHLFVNGQLLWSGAASETSLSSGYANTKIGADTYMLPGYFAFNGDICNMKIFNRALSPEEVAIEYKRTGPTKMTQYNGRTFIQGQFKEVTA